MTARDLTILRARLGLTQRQIADATGFSIRTVQDWEAGRRKIKPYAVAALSRVQPAWAPALKPPERKIECTKMQ